MKKKKSGIKEIESENKTQTVGRWNYMAEPKKNESENCFGFSKQWTGSKKKSNELWKRTSR